MMTCKQGTWANNFLLNACCDSQLWTKCPLHGYPEPKLRQCWSMRSSMPDFPSSCFYEWAAEILWQWTLLFLPGAKHATSQLVELDHSSIERECPLSCLRILWVKLGTSLQGEHPNVIQMKRQAVKPSTRLVREECSAFCSVNLMYILSCPFARRRSHRRGHHSHHRRHQQRHHHQLEAELVYGICRSKYKYTYEYICSNTNHRNEVFASLLVLHARPRAIMPLASEIVYFTAGMP